MGDTVVAGATADDIRNASDSIRKLYVHSFEIDRIVRTFDPDCPLTPGPDSKIPEPPPPNPFLRALSLAPSNDPPASLVVLDQFILAVRELETAHPEYIAVQQELARGETDSIHEACYWRSACKADPLRGDDARKMAPP